MKENALISEWANTHVRPVLVRSVGVVRKYSWSYLNGLLAVFFGLCVELPVYAFQRIFFGVTKSKLYVAEIWFERHITEIVGYMLGQLTFILLPLLLLITTGDTGWTIAALIFCPGGFVVFTVLTLLFPVGARKRYKWLITRPATGHERLFLGQMPPTLLFTASGDGLRSCIIEEVGYIIIICIGAAFTQLVLYQVLPLQFEADPQASIPAFGIELALMFLFNSVSAIFTAGYSGVAPSGVIAQLVATSEVLVGWIYLVGIVPTLVGVMVERPMRAEARSSTAPHRPTAGISAVSGGVKWLVERQGDRSQWKADLPADLLATCAAVAFLSKRGDPPSRRAAHDLELAAKALQRSSPRDLVGHTALRIATNSLSGIKLSNVLASVRNRTDPADNCAPILALIAIATGQAGHAEMRQWLPNNLEDWGATFGPHWECYSLLARLMEIEESIAPTNILDCPIGSELLGVVRDRRTDNGSWYEDTILTALLGLAVARWEVWAVPSEEAAIWLGRQSDQRPAGLPVVSGLPIWDTAWAISALARTRSAPEECRSALQWLLTARSTTCDGEWSWSDRLDMTCYDSTSLVCEVVQSLGTKDVRLVSALTAGIGVLGRVSADHRCPTFVVGSNGIHACPIISARRIAVLHKTTGRHALEIETILSESADGWTSDWFIDPSITEGLVLASLGTICHPRSSGARRLAKNLSLKDPLSVEGSSAAILGLKSALDNLGLSVRDRAQFNLKIRKLTDFVLDRQESSCWPGDPVGVFGFGRRYCDSVFATSLAILALASDD